MGTTNDAGARMRTLAQEVAPLLGEGWAYDTTRDDYTWAAFIDGPNGARLMIAAPAYTPAPAKLEINALLPDGSRDVLRYNENGRHEIGVSESRGAQVIAREITRRLLPAYLEQLADVQTRITKQQHAAATRAEVVQSLALAFRGSVASNGHRPDEARFGHGSRDYYGSVTVRHDATKVDLEMRGVSVDIARLIADVLKSADAED